MPVDSNIRKFIRQNGYITIDVMMKKALSACNTSYYKVTENIGSEGDFITAPELSQLFGEIVGLWVIEQWQKLGKPSEFILLELGPGIGTLMHDILCVAKLVPEFFSSVKIYFLEINQNFIFSQKEKMKSYNEYLSNDQLIWISSIYDISPKLPLIALANEFFDALPIKQYFKSEELWNEMICVVDPNDEMIKFDKMEVSKILQKQLHIDHPEACDGAVLEESTESLEIVRFIISHIKQYGGSVLIIDYGYNIEFRDRIRSQYNSTLQAVKNHKYCSLLSAIGEADITAHVDFNALKRTVAEQGIGNAIVTTQRVFLLQYGILLRLQSLQDKISREEYNVIYKQVLRLIDINQMGNLFKVLTCSNFYDSSPH